MHLIKSPNYVQYKIKIAKYLFFLYFKRLQLAEVPNIQLKHAPRKSSYIITRTS
jgi:hypothetical protein